MKASSYLFAFLLTAASSQAAALLAPGDFIVAINPNISAPNSSFPNGEPPSAAIDGTSAKYLNGGNSGSGFIVTPTAAAAMQSFVIQTGNDATYRDPSTYQVWGTNDSITSASNSTGTAETWVLISSGTLALPDARSTNSTPVSFSNSTAYSSYKVVFPQTKYNTGQQAMQINEFTAYTGTGGTGTSIFAPGNPIIAIDTPVSTSFHNGPGLYSTAPEGAYSMIDGSASTKYLNFGAANSGVIVTPSAGATTARSFTITTGNDFAGRDPSSYIVYGTNSSVTTSDNGTGLEDGNIWTEIASGPLDLPSGRGLTTDLISLGDNETAYTTYKVLFPTIKDSTTGSMQIAEFQLYSNAVPEPSATLLSGLALLALGLRRRR